MCGLHLCLYKQKPKKKFEGNRSLYFNIKTELEFELCILTYAYLFAI